MENLGRLVAAIEATGRQVWAVSLIHPNGTTGPTHYHLAFNPPVPYKLSARFPHRRIAGTNNRIWGRDVDALCRKIANFPVATGKAGLMPKRIAGVTDSEATGLRFLLQQLRRKGWYPLYVSVSAYQPEVVYYIQLPDEARTLLTGSLSAVHAKIVALPRKGD